MPLIYYPSLPHIRAVCITGLTSDEPDQATIVDREKLLNLLARVEQVTPHLPLHYWLAFGPNAVDILYRKVQVVPNCMVHYVPDIVLMEASPGHVREIMDQITRIAAQSEATFKRVNRVLDRLGYNMRPIT